MISTNFQDINELEKLKNDQKKFRILLTTFTNNCDAGIIEDFKKVTDIFAKLATVNASLLNMLISKKDFISAEKETKEHERYTQMVKNTRKIIQDILVDKHSDQIFTTVNKKDSALNLESDYIRKNINIFSENSNSKIDDIFLGQVFLPEVINISNLESNKNVWINGKFDGRKLLLFLEKPEKHINFLNKNVNKERRKYFVESNPTTTNPIGAVVHYSSYDNLFKRGSQSIKKQWIEPNTKLQEAWTAAQKKLEKRFLYDNEKNIASLQNEVCKYGKDSVIAAMVYSADRNNAIYEDFNFYIRASSFSFNYCSSTNYLFGSVITLYKNLISMQQKSSIVKTTLYRGCDVFLEKLKIGKIFSLGYFVSTSTDRQVALSFLRLEKEKNYLDETFSCTKFLFEYSGTMFGVNMSHMSDYPDENEVLLFPNQTFMVKNIVECRDQNGFYTVIQLFSQAEIAYKMFRKILPNFPDLEPFLTKPQLSNMTFSLLNDAISATYMISSSDLRHFQTLFAFEKTKNTQTLPNSHIFVFRHLIEDKFRFFPIILENFFNFNVFDVCFTTIVPNIKLLEFSKTNENPVYCKIQTEVYRTGEQKYTELDCFLYRLSQKEICHLHDFCIKKDSNATSFIISKKKLHSQNCKSFNQIFKKEKYSQINVAFVSGYWDYLYKDFKMFVVNNYSYKKFYEKEASDKIYFWILLFFGVFINLVMVFMSYLNTHYNSNIAVCNFDKIIFLIITLAIIASIFKFTKYFFKKNNKRNRTYADWFLCDSCNRRCNYNCDKYAYPFSFLDIIILFYELTGLGFSKIIGMLLFCLLTIICSLYIKFFVY